ncbi:tetratricopeptide (TPR) repeat protein [Pontibacter aydingkolensis]|uniref:Tetratricopeptide repeat protein n=1 Tax=Pontibacter aydingkolensis TaxID=1911536 RepID=A0ABS7CSM1_9BACT|nr:tetratricopeptide repeat protein [Pontibacter aydingkolensis]MBW7466844.1 tetratricopeptide repeat protein [Pontibacter aydingkolensis]
MNIYFILLFILVNNFPTIDSARGLARRALQQEMHGDLDDAEVNYKRALKSAPSLYQAQFNLGNTLFYQERYADALIAYQKLISTRGVAADLKAKAYHNTGITYLQLRKFRESKTALLQSLKLQPNDSSALYSLSYLLAVTSKLNKQSAHHKEQGSQDAQGDSNLEDCRADEHNKSDAENISTATTDDKKVEELILNSQELNEQKIKERMKVKVSANNKPIVKKDW